MTWQRPTLAVSIALAAVLAVGLPALAQADGAPGWHSFRSVAGRFEVLAPGAPERLVESRWTLAGRIDEVAYHFEWRGERFGVTYHDLPAIARVIFSPTSLLDRVVDELLEVMQGGRPLRSRDISLAGHPGRAIAYAPQDRPGTVEEVRIFLVGERLYLVEAATRPGENPGDDDAGSGEDAAERFFESFRLTES